MATAVIVMLRASKNTSDAKSRRGNAGGGNLNNNFMYSKSCKSPYIVGTFPTTVIECRFESFAKLVAVIPRMT